MSALAICHQPRIAPDDMGASQYQPSVTPELSALTIIHVQSDGRSVALIGPENGHKSLLYFDVRKAKSVRSLTRSWRGILGDSV